MNHWRIIAWIGAAVAVACVLASVALATARSTRFLGVKVTTRPGVAAAHQRSGQEPRDLEVVLVRADGRTQSLGTRPGESVPRGEEWLVSEPMNVLEVAALRFHAKNGPEAGPLAELRITHKQVEAAGHRFVFYTKRMPDEGVRYLLVSPLGQAIVASFAVAVLVVVISLIAAWQKSS